MRTTINLPEPLLESAKLLAEKWDVTLSVVVEDAVRAFLAKQSDKPQEPFSLHVVHGQLVDPNVDLDRTSELLLADDLTGLKKR